MSELTDRIRPLVGILGGLLVGGTLYAFARGALPGQLAFASAVVGVMAGLGARLMGAIGSPKELRLMVFGTLFATVSGEWFIYEGLRPRHSFAAHLVADPVWLVMTVLFLVAGIFFGVRLLVGTDPWADILVHGSGAVPPGAAGTECPRCGSLQTVPEAKPARRADQALVCQACDHRWLISGAPRPGGSAGRGS